MRINGRPELDYLVYWEPKERDSIGPKRVFIVGFNEDNIISEVVDYETGEITHREATDMFGGVYREFIDALRYNHLRDIKNRILGMPKHRSTEEAYVFGEVLTP